VLTQRALNLSVFSLVIFLGAFRGFHACWKVLDFFLENTETWKVLEIHFGPGKSGKITTKNHAFLF